MLSILIIKKSTCKILLLAGLALSFDFVYARDQNDWDLVDDTENNITYFELKNDESVRYIVDTKDFRLKHLDAEFKAVMPIEIGPVLQIEDLSLHGMVKKKISNDGTTGICFSRQATMLSGSISVYNNYLHLVAKSDDRPRITYVFLSNIPCSQSFNAKGGFFITNRIVIDGSKNRIGNAYEIRVNHKKLIQIPKGVVRLNFDSHNIVLNFDKLEKP